MSGIEDVGIKRLGVRAIEVLIDATLTGTGRLSFWGVGAPEVEGESCKMRPAGFGGSKPGAECQGCVRCGLKNTEIVEF